MWRVLLYLVLFGVAAYGAVWLADHPETLSVTWAGREYSTSLAVGVVAIIALAMALSLVWATVRFFLTMPKRIGRSSRQKKRDRGLRALTRGIVAVGAGDVAAARRHAGEAERLLGEEPLTLLLQAQAAQAAGNRDAAEAAFRRMTENPETRVLGLRGLFVEARRQGDAEAAREHAETAAGLAPTVAWANDALLEAHSAEGDWKGAIAAIERRSSLGLVDKAESRRQRAVLHAADALAREAQDPDGALAAAQEAVRLAPDLVPAAALAGKHLARKGDLRRAAKVIETAWRALPHPALAAAYLNLRPGDSAADRLRRAETLARLSSWAPESRLAIARAALDARQPARARDVLAPLREKQPTVRTCLLMADVEAADGNAGGVREWLARAARAPRDPAWMADGIVSETWAPVSPVTGRLDAFRWETPPAVLGAPVEPEATFAPEPIEPPAIESLPAPPVPEPPVAEPVVAAAEPEGEPKGEAATPLSPAEEPADNVRPLPRRPEPAPKPAALLVPEPDVAGRPSETRQLSPVVFPVAHPPDDPGADETEGRPPRLRFRG